MRTSELTGALLDYWVAKAEGMQHVRINRDAEPNACFMWERERGLCSGDAWKPSTSWAQGGPILEQISRVRIHRNGDSFAVQTFLDVGGALPIYGYGETILIAAMRCYVTSKFGSEVQEGSESNG